MPHGENQCLMAEGAWDQWEDRLDEEAAPWPPFSTPYANSSTKQYHAPLTGVQTEAQHSQSVNLPESGSCCVPVYLAPASCGCRTLIKSQSPCNQPKTGARRTEDMRRHQILFPMRPCRFLLCNEGLRHTILYYPAQFKLA